MNKATFQRILLNRYGRVTVKATSKNLYYYFNGKLVGTYDLAKTTGVIL